jgi:hypothetical protein
MNPLPPKVLTPAALLTELGGRVFYVIAVELWPNEILVRVAGVPTWRDEPGSPPRVREADNGEALIMGLHVDLSDDVGTVYKHFQSMSNGSGYEWRADYHLQPGAPADAAQLTVALASDPDRSVVLDLRESPS